MVPDNESPSRNKSACLDYRISDTYHTTKTVMARIRSVQKMSTMSINVFVSGASTNPPKPVPETAIPIAKPRCLTKYCEGTAIAG